MQIPQTQQLFDVINEGVSMMTFFGIRVWALFDFSIDNPSITPTKASTPSCSPWAAIPAISTLRRWGSASDFFLKKGPVAFAATSGQGYISSLYEFASEFYRIIGDEMYGQGIGDALRSAIRNKPSGGFGLDLIRQQFNFNCDPSLRLNPAPGPDYVIDAASAQFSPKQVTASLDTFELKFNTVNIGQRLPDSIVVQVTQRFPNGLEQIVVQQLIPSPGFSQEMVCKIPGKVDQCVGLNRFFIEVDATDRVAELLPRRQRRTTTWSAGGEPGFALHPRQQRQASFGPRIRHRILAQTLC
ncbi:MAG: hypothetical protein IPM82_19580 [Saprospiraceae bacterium]|nr:hypothetical protein [Saprospiraceae bacterium]